MERPNISQEQTFAFSCAKNCEDHHLPNQAKDSVACEEDKSPCFRPDFSRYTLAIIARTSTARQYKQVNVSVVGTRTGVDSYSVFNTPAPRANLESGAKVAVAMEKQNLTQPSPLAMVEPT